MELALNLDGIAGVCGVWGEMGFPGEEDVDVDVPATIGGTLDNCRLDEVEERWRSRDDDIDSESAAFESLIFWNLERAAPGRLAEASALAASLGASKLFKFFCLSSSFKKSDMSSSSVWTEPELPPCPPSMSIPEPGWAVEDARLPLPLLLLSSSVLLVPPDDNLALLCVKLLLYLLIGAAFGDPDAEDAIAFSGGTGEPLENEGDCCPIDVRPRACVAILGGGNRPTEFRGEEGAWSVVAGDAESEGALKGWNDTEGRRWGRAPSLGLVGALAPCAVRVLGRTFRGGEVEGESEPSSLAARRAESGLELVGGATWWKVERLP
jgi:hypothetical protein